MHKPYSKRNHNRRMPGSDKADVKLAARKKAHEADLNKGAILSDKIMGSIRGNAPGSLKRG